LFEPHSEIIRKGKASKPTEFGKMVQVQGSRLRSRARDPAAPGQSYHYPIALLGLGPADSGLALFAILQGFVDSELRSVKIFHPKNEDLGRPKTTGR
jgi:hypothetical protein